MRGQPAFSRNQTGVNNGRTEEVVREIIVSGDGPSFPKGLKIYTWPDGRFVMTNEPHPVSSEMQPHEEKPDLTEGPYRVEGSGPSVKDPPPQGETDDRLK